MMTSPKSNQASSSSSSSSSSPFSCTTMLSNPSLDRDGEIISDINLKQSHGNLEHQQTLNSEKLCFAPASDRYHDGEQLYNREEIQPPAEYTFVSHGGSYDHHSTLMHESDKYGLKLPIRKRRLVPTNNEDYYQSCENNNNNNSIENGSSTKKWMSSEMRLMQKMMINGSNDQKRGANNEMNTSPAVYHHHHVGDDHKKLNSSSNFDNPIRVCSDCNTTKTPLWRGGPCGPKSLCNACGIRQRKARRAMSEAASNGAILATTTTSSHHVKTKVVVQQKYKKKRSKKLSVPSSSSTSQKLGFEDFMLSLREKYSEFQRVFPQDEKEAAILLMALSHGLVL